jgi:hypothetical protein
MSRPRSVGRGRGRFRHRITTVLKLLVMLVTFLGIGLALLGLRQRRLELNSQSVQVYSQIRERNETLLDLDVVIARQTNPWALANNLKQAGVNTGGALEHRGTRIGRTPPAVESDLIAPLR